VLRAHGVRVLTVREILAFGVEERMGARVELEELAAATLTYKLAEGAHVHTLAHTHARASDSTLSLICSSCALAICACVAGLRCLGATSRKMLV
jgi:hypothetical protein